MPDDPNPLVETRLALQSLAEHVLCAARHAATGRIGLVPAPGGFATPPFPSEAGDRTVAVEGLELVVTDDRGERRAALTTVGAAAALMGIEPGAPTEVFTPTTPLAPDAPLAIDPDAAARIAGWYALAGDALAAFRSEVADLDPGEVQLWPEHFDVAFPAGEVNWGASPGDATSVEPYLYVGPWSPPEPDGGYWDAPFGATCSGLDVDGVDAALAFFREGRRRLSL